MTASTGFEFPAEERIRLFNDGYQPMKINQEDDGNFSLTVPLGEVQKRDGQGTTRTSKDVELFRRAIQYALAETPVLQQVEYDERSQCLSCRTKNLRHLLICGHILVTFLDAPEQLAEVYRSRRDSEEAPCMEQTLI